MVKISAVINTWNEEENIGRCLKSIKDFADEIVVVDMKSEDKTVEIAKKFGVKIFTHKQTLYVEPARNFALRQAQGKHILVIDADEVLPQSLAKRLKKIAEGDEIDYVEIPRKNIIFGKWIEYSLWWPDYNIRFFRKGKVKWSDKIHAPPKAEGLRKKLPANQENAIIHHHYQNVSQYVERLNRYTNIQAENLIIGGYKFKWPDLLRKPTDEFLSRFFAGQGYKDGLHGLTLAFLQAFSELILYLKVWEKEKFTPEEKILKEFKTEAIKTAKDFRFWQNQAMLEQAPFFKKPFLRLKNKFT